MIKMGKLRIVQNKTKKGNIDTKSQILGVELKDKNGNKKVCWVHSYLIGMEMAIKVKQVQKNSSLVLVVGAVGTGKSTLVKTIAAINGELNDTRLKWEHIHWDTENFCKAYQDEKYKGHPIIFDESIGSISRVNSTSQGEMLKRTLVTSRFMQRTAYLLVDRVEEFNHRLVVMSDILIRVRKMGMRRGYADVYTDKRKIEFIYKGFKQYKKDWSSPEIRNIKPDCKLKFEDYSNTFYDENEYDKRKLESTKQVPKEKTTKTEQKRVQEKITAITNMRQMGKTNKEIGIIFGMTDSAVRTFCSRHNIN